MISASCLLTSIVAAVEKGDHWWTPQLWDSNEEARDARSLAAHELCKEARRRRGEALLWHVHQPLRNTEYAATRGVVCCCHHLCSSLCGVVWSVHLSRSLMNWNHSLPTLTQGERSTRVLRESGSGGSGASMPCMRRRQRARQGFWWANTVIRGRSR